LELDKNVEEYQYSFSNEISEILKPTNGRVCGYECTEEMREFLDQHADKVIAFCKRLKKKYNKNERNLFEY